MWPIIFPIVDSPIDHEYIMEGVSSKVQRMSPKDMLVMNRLTTRRYDATNDPFYSQKKT